MKTTKLTRRQFLGLSAGTASLLTADAIWIEPSAIKTRFVQITHDRPTHRLVQFSDTHHKGDRAFLAEAVKTINALSPDFVCFTGDLVEQSQFAAEALEILQGIKSPLFGVPGNHDYTSGTDFKIINDAFATTGGRWLQNENVTLDGGQIHLIGSTCSDPEFLVPQPNTKNIALIHYPEFVEKLEGKKFDLVMAGHSHGGQVRLPIYGAIYVPKGTGRYDMGLYHTPSGPLYVNAGLGFVTVDVRFNCRPEITVFEV